MHRVLTIIGNFGANV